MKLFVYDHCPYCVKARMIFGFKSVPFELVCLLNDDEETPISMIGKKMLPVLQRQDGEFMPESLDIIDYVDGLSEFGAPIVHPSKQDAQLNAWLQSMRRYHYKLAMPRWIHIGLDEFKTQGAIDYFTNKKEKSIGPFSQALKQTSELIAMAHDHLKELEKMVSDGPYFWGESLTIDDFHVFAGLRCLTTTKGLSFSDKINNYMNRISEQSKVPLHWDVALGEDFNG